jgi:hypothetical protein
MLKISQNTYLPAQKCSILICTQRVHDFSFSFAANERMNEALVGFYKTIEAYRLQTDYYTVMNDS